MKKITLVFFLFMAQLGVCSDHLRQTPKEYRVKKESFCSRSLSLMRKFSNFMIDAFLNDEDEGEEQCFEDYWSGFDVNVSRLLAETHRMQFGSDIWVPIKSLDPVFYRSTDGETGLVVLKVGKYVSEYFNRSQ